MHYHANSRNNQEPGVNSNNSYAVCSQPWWCGIVHDGISGDMLGERMANISLSREPKHRDLGNKTSKSQGEDGMERGTDANKETIVTAVSQADGKFGEHQPPQHAASIVHPPLGEYLMPSTQLELVGHSFACSSHPYSNSYYGEAVPAYGPQALVHSQCVGVRSGRIALPLEMAEEPVYVNAKQYHGILRRRQLRAKAELEKKIIKVRKPYLHESRHLHALRRARGCGGRFLNTKKPDSQASNVMSSLDTSSGAAVSTQQQNSSSSVSVPNYCARSGDSSTGHQEVIEPQVHKMQPQQRYSSGHGKTSLDGNDNGSGFYPHNQGFQLFKYHSLSDNKVEEGKFSGQQSERIVGNRAQHRALTIK